MSDPATPAADATPPAAPFLAGEGAPPASVIPSASEHFFSDRVAKDGSFVEGWTSSLADKHPALANQMMRYKTESDAFTGLENLVKTVGRKAAGVSYPKEGATPEEVAAFRTDAGVPGRAEEYMLKPEKLPDGVTWNDATSKQFSDIMHAHHIPAGAAKALVAAHLETSSGHAKAAADAAQARLVEMVGRTTKELQQEWGVDFQNRVDVNNDFIGARLSAEDMADPALKLALSHPAIVRIVDEARRAGREATLPGANNSVAVGSMTPRQQAMEIMKSNPSWRRDTVLAGRVNDLYKQESQAMKRQGK
jgi:hypothetical protein